jgi:hypothetical protein
MQHEIINEQVTKVWGGKGWSEKLFYVYSGNIIVELQHYYRNEYLTPPKDYGVPIMRIIAKNKAQLVNGQLFYPKNKLKCNTK